MEDYELLEQLGAKGSAEAEQPAQTNGAADDHGERRRDRSRERGSRSKDRKERSRDRERSKRRSRSRSKDRSRRSRSRDRDRRRDKDRSRSRDRGERERYDHRGGGGRDRYESRGGGGGGYGFGGRGGGGSYRRRERTPPEERLAREKERELKEMDRATRTIFASNLNLKADERDIFKFFSQAGTVNDIQLITDKNTRRSKGMAYIEYRTQQELFMAISTLNGQIFMNMPVMLKTSEVEKNLAWEAQQAVKQQQSNADAANSLLTAIGGAPGVPAGLGSCRLQVNNLHPGLEDVDLKDAFEPFGFLELIQVVRDPATNQSLGYGFVQYREFADGVKAMQHWNAKPLGGKTLEVQMAALPPPLPAAPVVASMLPPDMMGLGGMPGLATIPGLTMPGLGLPGMPGLPGPPPMGMPGTDPAAAAAANPYAALMQQQQQLAAAQAPQPAPQPQINELDEMDEEGGKGGLRLDAQKRAALMQRLAAAAGLETKPATFPGMPGAPGTAPGHAPPPAVAQNVMLDQGLLGPASPIPTPAILLKNMFDPAEEEARGEPNWVAEVENDVREECSRFGEVQHLFVDKNSKGFVYVRFAAQQGAEAAHKALNLRWYSGKQIIVDYQFVHMYNGVFGLK